MVDALNDHFSSFAKKYALFRPSYPPELFSWLAGLTPGRSLAWDCACGNGQASLGLVAYFDRVFATDISHTQLDAATPHSKIEYRLASAEQSGLENHSVDLITIATALHWLDIERFNAEAQRILKPGGVIAAWSYSWTFLIDAPSKNLKDQLNFAVNSFRERIKPFWPHSTNSLENGYKTLPFPFDVIDSPFTTMRVFWNLYELSGHINTWSATARFMESQLLNPVVELENELTPLWGDPTSRREITWPLSMRVGRSKLDR